MKKYLAILPVFLHSCINGYILRKFTRDRNTPKCLPMMLIELIKLGISIFIKSGEPIKYNLEITVPTVFYFLQNLLLWNFAARIDPLYFATCYQSRIISLCIISIVLLNKRFKMHQYFGQFLIFVGIILPEIFKENKIEKNNELIPCLGIILSGFLTSLSSVYFEHRIRNTITYFWDYSFQYSIYAVTLSFIASIIEFSVNEIDIWKFVLNVNFWLIIVTNSIGSMIISYLATVICPLTRTFFMILASAASTIVITFLLDSKLDIKNLFSFGIVYLGTSIYEYESLRKMFVKVTPKSKSPEEQI
ncbi:putative nucleotide-sugar transporter [Hamiltosporidium magnivora]|uniref:Putative nucleotide-sugar transporter n=2 Tax=Hamiltosporidium magnivora TaxID=148818 RepID=A0A4Q9LCK8_9MICR|nr:putative nucleotide-sugar transporter [Hamiltosporidium magnivora]